MVFAVAVLELFGQPDRMLPTPCKVIVTGPNPLGHGVVDVGVTIATDVPVLTGRRGHHLATLNQHLVDVLVCVVLRSNARVIIEEKYIHLSSSCAICLMVWWSLWRTPRRLISLATDAQNVRSLRG
jgi:hypothetical protein